MNKSPIVNITIKKKMFAVAYDVVEGEITLKKIKKLLVSYKNKIKRGSIGKNTMKEYQWLLQTYRVIMIKYKKSIKLEKKVLKSKNSKIYDNLKEEAFISYLMRCNVLSEKKKPTIDYDNFTQNIFSEEMDMDFKMWKKIHKM